MALLLQEEGVEVTAVEVIPEAVEIMKDRGVVDARRGRLEDLPEEMAYDTILLLMNGAALAGTLDGLGPFLGTLRRLLARGGQLLLAPSDLLGGEGGENGDGGPWGEGEYPGEFHYQMEFRGERGSPFPQLFVDPATLEKVASDEGWRVEVVWWGEEGESLARLTPSGQSEGGTGS